MTAKIKEFLKAREFISVATCDFSGRPNAAPKFVLKVEHNCVYLIDYSLSRTWENLKINPVVSLSFMDTDSLKGYQVNGPVEIIDKGPQFKEMLEELRAREINLSVKRIIEGVHRQKAHGTFELEIPERFVVFKVAIKEITEIGSKGELRKENL